MLRQVWCIAVVVLLTMAVLSSTPALALACVHPDRPAGHPSNCHRHGPRDRQPANHVCCAAGRDVAIPVSAFSGLQLSYLYLDRLHEIVGAPEAAGCLFCFAESFSPPAAVSLSIPLRI
jgi:hypothetical protein